MSKITLKGYIKVPKSELNMIIKELEIHKKLTREELGCVTFKVTQSKENPTRFDVYEEFMSEAAFDYHQKRVLSSRWGKKTKNVKRFYEIYE